MKRILLSALVAITFTAMAGTKSPARTALETKNYDKVISLVNKVDLKTAEDYYLLGKANYDSGRKLDALKAWKECLQTAKLSGNKSFIFTPGKKLTGVEKKAIYSSFLATYKTLAAAGVNKLQNEQKEALKKAARIKLDAKRADAHADRLNKKGDAAGEAINSLQKSQAIKANAKSKKPVRVKKSGGSGMIIIIVVIAIIIFFVVFAKFKQEPEAEYARAGFGTDRYDIIRNDEYFLSGAFWFQGCYYHNHHDFHSSNGYYYTNNMYHDNYDNYGHGQGRDEALDNEIMNKIDQRQDLREEAADAEFDADNLRIDAEELELDAEEAQEEIDELQETLEFEAPEFEDDEGSDEEVAEIEEPEFEDDEPEFEDDEEA